MIRRFVNAGVLKPKDRKEKGQQRSYGFDGHKRQRMGSFMKIDDMSIMHVCKKLFDSANERRNRIRAILIDAWAFRPCISQVDLFHERDERITSLSHAIDKIRLKYGVRSLQNADVLQTSIRDKCLSI